MFFRNLNMSSHAPLKSFHDLPSTSVLISHLAPNPLPPRKSYNDSRPVPHGHYVVSAPEPLKNPKLICGSRSFAKEIGLVTDSGSDSTAKGFVDGGVFADEDFVRFFSADGSKKPEKWPHAWATCYGVSIHGQWGTNSPFGVYGYGDGRAMSVAEVAGSSAKPRKTGTEVASGVLGPASSGASSSPKNSYDGSEPYWELQMKGCGRTPFSRNHDGRAVVRSSIREFLASECFHHLGVPSTRALCVIASTDEAADGSRDPGTKIQRQWYGDSSNANKRGEMIRNEPCAITTRSAPSFLRVGQIELFARTREDPNELRQIVAYALEREFPHIVQEVVRRGGGAAGGSSGDGAETDWEKLPADRSRYENEGYMKALLTQDNVLKMLECFAERQSTLHAEWLRVGYIQSNMNNDNALLNGRTMDFGPFGMLEEYDSKQTIWVGDAGYFAFENQLSAGAVIFFTLLQACAGLFTPPNFPETEFNKFAERATAILKEYMPLANRKWHARLGAKLGFGPDGWGSGGSGENLPVEKWWKEAKVVLEREKVDYTHFFRALAEFSEEEFRAVSSMGETGKIRIEGTGFERMLYRGSGKWEGPVENVVKGWIKLVKDNSFQLVKENSSQLATLQHHHSSHQLVKENSPAGVPDFALMKRVSPSIIPRNWMMTLAYEAAEQGDYSITRELHQLFEEPYKDSKDIPCTWMRKSPDWQYGKGGVRFMS